MEFALEKSSLNEKGPGVGVIVGVSVGMGLGVIVGVSVAAAVGVRVGVNVGVMVGVSVGKKPPITGADLRSQPLSTRIMKSIIGRKRFITSPDGIAMIICGKIFLEHAQRTIAINPSPD